ncbi:hypothetical protein MLD38_009524 [Melastoma candidum]|uniref:Uncharacterized protein n=1 Tax=Melastoma candidum TaxID=119954 RepID=A0ACB9S1I8_9MYRT|nr:hypothetical protein MLD38_009524 [Melastoma candidum]
MEKSSQLSLPSPSVWHRHDVANTFSPSPCSPSSTIYRSNHMKFMGSRSREVSEELPSPLHNGISLVFPIQSTINFVLKRVKGTEQHFKRADGIRGFREEEGRPELEDAQNTISSHEDDQYHDSDDEFNEPSTEKLVHIFKNLNKIIASSILISFVITAEPAQAEVKLYAWERKLDDEVKASQEIRRDYDAKCKLLRQLESQKSSSGIAKTRALVKALHSRIKVVIHRIDSISKRIEELRDRELQPQLEESIDWLSRMFEVMSKCHRLQFKMISVAYCNSNTRIATQSESHNQIGVTARERAE